MPRPWYQPISLQSWCRCLVFCDFTWKHRVNASECWLCD
ncbi:hypothetical protein RB3624 [Rhodopirellula baltica SH 1]|uniref:Uncharacterized protein n=1 Tax=Rhodopirellula baltica (strain DSM 10527 / NCIMB 13988 / SH1) TaxID=243090 RepID=Q7UTY1_RHOBA|nr:hypothetical protein RB3624 [Rhodopirellula baltica SH 1]